MRREEAKGSDDWKDKIVAMGLVKQELQQVDKLKFWPHHLPETEATEEQLAATEAHLGHSIDKDYRDFLLCANGWKAFTQSVNLFGTEDLMGSGLMEHASEMLKVLDDAFPLSESSGFSRAELLPIAATLEERDLHVMTRPTSQYPGIVIWLSGQEIERYPNFREYFLAMVDYNRLEIDWFEKNS